MTNLEVLKKKSAEEIANIFCDLYEDDCGKCPVESLCGRGQNGWVVWLKCKVCKGETLYTVMHESEENDG